MKKMKKYLSVALALVMLFACLASCGGEADKPGSSPAGSNSPAPSDSPSGGNSEQSGGNAADAWAPIGSEGSPVDVKVMVKDVFPDEEDVQLLCTAVSEKMAAHGQYVKLIFVEPPASSYSTALPLAVMNGEVDADLIYFQGGDKSVSDQGLLEDLTPYIDSSTYVKDLMDDTNKTKLANYPYLLWLAPPRVTTPVIRTDWAEQMDSYKALVDDPTPDNYYNFFKELKDKGLVECAITADGDTARLDTIFNHAFGVTGTVVKEDGKWIFSKASQAEKSKLEYYAKLYKDGLLDPDYLTNTWDVMEQKFYEGKAGVVSGTAGAVIQIYNQKMVQTNGDASQLTVLPPAKGVSQSYTSVDVTKESRGFAINVDSKNKDAAFAVLEFMASPEGRILDKVGIEGIHYNVEGDKIVFTDKFPSWWARFWDTVNKFEPKDPSLAEPVLSVPAQNSLDQVVSYMMPDTNLLIPSELTPQWDAMKNLYNEYASDIIRGVKPVSAFDEFVEKWNAAGGNDFDSLLQSTFG